MIEGRSQDGAGREEEMWGSSPGAKHFFPEEKRTINIKIYRDRESFFTTLKNVAKVKLVSTLQCHFRSLT